jgi:Zn-dependent M28 family amino/carboxypeptidase
MRRRAAFRFLSLALAFSGPVSAGPSSASDRYGPIDANRISSHVRILASDDFQGRAPGTAGEEKTVNYLIASFKAMGLEAGGPAGSWTQPVSLIRTVIGSPISLTLISSKGEIQVADGSDFVLNARSPSGRVRLMRAPIVFVGYGIDAPEIGWNDFDGADLAGKICIVLAGTPTIEPFSSASAQKHRLLQPKLKNLAGRGAAGALVIVARSWDIIAANAQVAQYEAMPTTAGDTPPLLASLHVDRAASWFAAASLDYAAVSKAANAPGFRPIALEGFALSADYAVKKENIITHNVIARRTGAKHPDEVVLYMAHWDHLGLNLRKEKGADRIYNGAIDNAAGVAALLETARAFAKGEPTDRSIVFMATTGEELGFWGINAYVSDPIYPLETTVAVMNFETMSLHGPTQTATVFGFGKTTMDADEVVAAAAKQGRKVAGDDSDPTLYYRSDHLALARKGVPALYLSWGAGMISDQAYSGEKYLAERYHHTTDDWYPEYDWRGGAQNTELLYEVGRSLAMSRVWPEWTEGAEFKSVRDESAAARQ